MNTRRASQIRAEAALPHIRKSSRILSRVEAAASIQDSEKPVVQLRKKQKVPHNSGENETQNKVQDKTNYKRVKGKRGHLKMITEMPMDILLEIFCQLEPVDLLHLSRASKSLRGILVANNIEYIWKMVSGFPFSNLQTLGISFCFRLTTVVPRWS